LRKDFKQIEAILLLDVPKNWESALQLLLNLLITHGDPRVKFNSQLKLNSQQKHLPVIVLNDEILKLTNVDGINNGFRFAHGAFIECLQVLYKVGIFFSSW
jgi:hypothetical protein